MSILFREAVDPDNDGDDDSGTTDADDFPLAGVGYPCAHCHNPVRGRHKRCAVCGSKGPHLFPPSHMSGGPLSTLVSDKKMALMSAAVREAVAVAFNPALHPRGRGGKFREILGKLHELSPGTSRRFGGHLVTRGFGGEEHVFALQRGADLVHRGSAEEVAGRLAPARATKARTTAGDLMSEKSMLGGIMGTRSQHYDSLRKQGVEHEDAMYAALHAQGLSDEEAQGAHLTYGPDLDPEKAVATPAAAEFARAARGQQVTLFDRPQVGDEVQGGRTIRSKGQFKRGDPVRLPDGRTGKVANVSDFGAARYGVDVGEEGEPGFHRVSATHDELTYAPEHHEKIQAKLDKAQGSKKPPSSKDLLKSFVGMRFPGISTPHNVPDEWVVENGYGEFVNPAMTGRNYGNANTRRYHPEEGSRVRLMPNASTVERNDAGLPHHRAGQPGVLVSTGKGTTSGTDVVRFDGDIGATRVLSRDVMGEEDRAFVRLKPGVDTESMQYHYLVGHPPRTKFGPNSAGYAQWMYGMPKKYGGTGPVKAGEKEAVLRRIAGAVEAIQEGDRVTYERLLSEACEIKALTEGPLGAIHVAGVARFDPARHPRGRGGKWVDVLGKLREHGYHSLGLGISVEHDGMVGFKVRDGSNRVIRFSDDVTAVKHAVSLHENQRRRAFGPAFVRRAPGGERVELAPPREPGEPLELHSPHAAGLAAHVLRGMGREFAARDAETNHEIHVENHSDTELEKLASAFRDRGHHTSASFVHRELDARRARDAGSGFERASLAPRVREPGSVSKAQALVDSGLASDMADARAQLADMGELTRRTPGEGGEDLGVYGTEQLHMAAERLRRMGNLTDAQHVQRELNRRYRESSLQAPRPMGMGHVLRSPGGERLPFGAERARAVIARSDGETPQARVEGHFFDLPMARNRGESFPEGTTGLAHYERIGAGGLWRFVPDESQPGPGFREHPTRAEARASMLRARAAYPSADARVSRAVQRLSATMAEHPLSREDALAMGRHTPGGERTPSREMVPVTPFKLPKTRGANAKWKYLGELNPDHATHVGKIFRDESKKIRVVQLNTASQITHEIPGPHKGSDFEHWHTFPASSAQEIRYYRWRRPT